MSQLQKLLDERWPLNADLSDTDRSTMEMFRRIFTEGWNVALDEVHRRAEGFYLLKTMSICEYLKTSTNA